jgi:two-component system, LuxR family, sensor kinase FixL
MTTRARRPAAAATTDLGAQRHLEDRERLLFTSRDVSVGEMASTLAHEINQPVGTVANVLRGALARLEHWPPPGGANREEQARMAAQLQQGLRLALDQALFAGRIIGRIREYTHSRQPRRERVALHALLEQCVALLDWEFARDRVEATLALAPGEGEGVIVMGDAVMLQQVVVNLLRNALDALREGQHAGRTPRIGVRTRLPSGSGALREVEIDIADNGIGLSSDAEQTLFVPFQSSKPSGMGIGLNICRSFIELHQGRLWFTRNVPDVGGCTFHIALPLA